MAPQNATWDGSDSQGNPLRWDLPNLTWNGLVPEPPTPKRMPHLRVSLGFANGPDHTVEETATAVSANLFGNAAFPSPPVTKTALDAANATLASALAAAQQGGPADTAAKNDKRQILIGLLRQLAGYVQANHHDDLAILLSSGFDAVSSNHTTPSTIAKPTIKDIRNGGTGELILRANAIANIRIWKVRYYAIGAGGVPGPVQDGGLHSDSRRILIPGLTPGTVYSFQIQAIGGKNTESDWSDAVSHMST